MNGSDEVKPLSAHRKKKSDVNAFRRQRAFCRKRAVQFLYGLDVCDDWMMQSVSMSNFKDMLDDLDEDSETLPEEDRQKAYPYMEELIMGAREHLNEIDGLIRKAAKNWRLERMSPVDRCILRVAVYEMKYVPKVSAATAINEAVELSKSFGLGDTPRFINGVLEKIRKILENPQVEEEPGAIEAAAEAPVAETAEAPVAETAEAPVAETVVAAPEVSEEAVAEAPAVETSATEVTVVPAVETAAETLASAPASEDSEPSSAEA